MSIQTFQRGECQICLEDPFKLDKTLKVHSWNGHCIISDKGHSSEIRKVHGICQKCLPSTMVNENLLLCFSCTYSFPNGQRTTLVITKEGSLVSEMLGPSINDLLKNSLASRIENATLYVFKEICTAEVLLCATLAVFTLIELLTPGMREHKISGLAGTIISAMVVTGDRGKVTAFILPMLMLPIGLTTMVAGLIAKTTKQRLA